MRRLSPTEAAGRLATASGPAWIIDAAGAKILGHNAAGAAMLGVAGTALDAAMPGIARLRAIVRAGAAPGEPLRDRLVLWTLNGVRRLDCTIEPVSQPDARVALLILGSCGAGTELAKSAVDGVSSAMDDRATLREIARRIREGTEALSAGAGDAPVTSANTALKPRDPGLSRIEPGRSAAEKPHEQLQTEFSPAALAELAHELKTPLSAIAAASEIMKDERLGAIGNDRYRGYAADIHDGARHALEVIERLLVGAAAGTQTETRAAGGPTAVDINAIARSCISSIAPLVEAKGIVIGANVSTRPALVVADATSVRQMILNLLTNAVKFCRAGDRVTVATRTSPSGDVRIEVRDTGPGMSKAELEAVREARQPSPQRWREGGGFGLGLPLVRKLAEANDARLDIDSRPGHGTVAAITFKGRAGPKKAGKVD